MTEPRLAWRIPLRNQSASDTQQVAHLMPLGMATIKLFKTYCGLAVNPGFAASPAPSTKQCTTCARWAESIKFPHYGKPNASSV